MRVFISQPMSEKLRTDAEIENERKKAIEAVKAAYPDENIEVIDSFFSGAPYNANPLWFLGKSLELLSTADLVYFAEGWQDARGCRIEFKCAVAYGIKFMMAI